MHKVDGFSFKTNVRHTTANEIDKFIVAKHMNENSYHFDLSDSRLVHRIDKCYELDSFESLYINKHRDNIMNEN